MDGRCKMNDITPNNPRQTGTISNIEEPNWNKEKPRIPEFIDLLEQSKAIHLKKNADYASAANPFSNFERSALLMQWFKDPIDKSFVNLIGTKLARIAELSDGRSPNNESLDDSFLDLLTYVGLWGAYVKKQRNQIKNE
jgi:hypothetical protein